MKKINIIIYKRLDPLQRRRWTYHTHTSINTTTNGLFVCGPVDTSALASDHLGTNAQYMIISRPAPSRRLVACSPVTFRMFFDFRSLLCSRTQQYIRLLLTLRRANIIIRNNAYTYNHMKNSFIILWTVSDVSRYN